MERRGPIPATQTLSGNIERDYKAFEARTNWCEAHQGLREVR
jgi:hypothetical protein